MKIVLPFFSGDEWLLRKNLEWYAELDPHIDRDCVLACDEQTDPKLSLAIAQKLFRSVKVCQYPRAYHQGRLMLDWPWQQNNSFACTARFMARQKEPWFWCETDCTPLKSGWWKVLEDEYAKGKKPFGGHWNAEAKIFNGVAVYPARVAYHCPEAIMASLKVDSHNRQNPWDAACSSRVFRRLHVMNNVMQHLWCLPGQLETTAPTFPNVASVEKFIRPEVVLFHRCKDGSLIDRMREIRGSNIPVTTRGVDIVKQRQEVPKTDIFIVTFARDLAFAEYCLCSIQKFATGFNETVMLVPEKDFVLFELLTDIFPNLKVKTFKEVPGKGMIHHEAMICSADQFCSADFILHMDADCIFKEPVTPLDYFKDGKPVMLKESYAKLIGNGRFDVGVGNWQIAVEKALGFKPQYETMRRHPEIYPRDLYAKVRAAVEQHTRKPFVEYVLSCRNEYPQGFAEFNTIGAWALQNAPDLHHWINCDTEERPKDKLYQFWSKGGLEFIPSDGPHKGRRFIDIIKEVLP